MRWSGYRLSNLYGLRERERYVRRALLLRLGLWSKLRLRLFDVFERRRGFRSGDTESGLPSLLLAGVALDVLEERRRFWGGDTDSRPLDLLWCDFAILASLSCASLKPGRFRDRCGDGDRDLDDLVEMVETESESDDIE